MTDDRLIFDGHLDLAMNAVLWNRDLRRPLDEIRNRETGANDKLDRGKGTTCLPEMRKGRIGICVATQLGHYVASDNPIPGWNSPEIAWAQTQAQKAWYDAMLELGEMVQIRTTQDLSSMFELWNSDEVPDQDKPIGFILSLEGADSLLTLDHLERAYDYGLRVIGPAHYGIGRYAPGTGGSGGLPHAGRELVREIDRLGMLLDTTHLTDEAFWETLEIFDGPVWASHNNCRSLVSHQRQFSDDQIRALIERDAIIGSVFDAWMMVPGWERGISTPQQYDLRIEKIVEHIDHISQIAGDSKHCCLGSDLDGGYGIEQTPVDLQSIADLQRVALALDERGYAEEAIQGIMHANSLRFFAKILPPS